MFRTKWQQKADEDYIFWKTNHPEIADTIDELVADMLNDPFTGIGNPKELERDLKGLWSRRITKEHRLVYLVSGDLISILRCRYHYIDVR
uniref:Putative mRNA interferase YoeB n=1 Tax=uncultured bacterium contig00074 TaxID=1181553 RepID=A0A806KG86_9BACT|nr:addiction module toxin Txe [uncultured bacterium contig00074]